MIHFGIDISKNDFHVYTHSEQRCFDQTSRGYSSLISWAKKFCPASEMVFVMEATGVYHQKLAHFLYLKGYGVAVINPQRIHHYAKSLGSRVKSDKVDARIIWDFGKTNQVEGDWKPLAENIVQLRFWIKDPTGGLTNIRGNVFLALWDTFHDHNISIPFPQREVTMLDKPAD